MAWLIFIVTLDEFDKYRIRTAIKSGLNKILQLIFCLLTLIKHGKKPNSIF